MEFQTSEIYSVSLCDSMISKVEKLPDIYPSGFIMDLY